MAGREHEEHEERRPIEAALEPVCAGAWRGRRKRNGPALKRLRAWLSAFEEGKAPPGLEPIKRRPARAVLRSGGEAGAGGVYIKRCLVDTVFDRLRYALKGSRAREEFRNLERLRSLGLPVVEPLAWLERRRFGVVCEGVLITKAAHGRAPLATLLPALSAARAQALVTAYVRLVARLHDAGFVHGDLHLGNALAPIEAQTHEAVPGADERGGGLVLVDLQKVRDRGRGRGVAFGERALDLGELVAALGDHLDERACRRVVERYVEAVEGGAALDQRAFERRVFAAAERLRRARIGSRATRCVRGGGAGFRKESGRGWRLFRRADMPREAVFEAIERHRALVAAGRGSPGVIKVDRRTAVTRVEGVAGGAPSGVSATPFGRGSGQFETERVERGLVCVKEQRPRGLLRTLGHAVVRHRGMQAWRSAHWLLLHGFETPAPLALLEQRRWGLTWASFYLSRWELGAEELPTFLDRRFAANYRIPPGGRARGTWEPGGERQPLGPPAEAAAVRALGALIGRLHAAGIYHGDLKPPNILVREEPRYRPTDPRRYVFSLIDLESLRPGARLGWARRVKNLAQLADWVSAFERGVKRTHFVRFLRAYAAYVPQARVHERRLVAAIEREVADKRRRREALGKAPDWALAEPTE